MTITTIVKRIPMDRIYDDMIAVPFQHYADLIETYFPGMKPVPSEGAGLDLLECHACMDGTIEATWRKKA
jgi:hypothetical protein